LIQLKGRTRRSADDAGHSGTENKEMAMKGIWRWLTRPSATTSVLTLLVVGVAVGVAGWITFNGVLHATGTTEFCGTACHSHAEFIYPDFKKSVHYANRTGVSAGCSDCHIPREFFPKLITKTKAGIRDGFGEFVQHKISTREKYEAELPRMYASVREEMKARDSRECRNCHEFTPEVFARQSPAAQAIHPKIKEMGQTCVDCHTGVAHSVPGQPKLGTPKQAPASAAASGGEAIADKLGCLGCHGVNEAKMGPALKDAAAKLKGKLDAAALAAKLGKGDGHPPISGSADDLGKASDWVLSLAPGGAAAKSADAKPAAKPAAPTDAQAAADQAGCLGCHGVNEKKMGPALKEAGHAWRGKADALAAKLKAGTGHPPVAASDADLKKIAGWVASL
jgi:cytochrome c-type protein NapC